MVLRIEDTDRERSSEATIAQILDALRWLELDWDGDPVSQFARRDRHQAAIERLLEQGKAYYDSATAEQVKAWRAVNRGAGYRGRETTADGAAIRLRVPDSGTTVVDDRIRGEVRFENRLLDDLVIARADGTALYNFAVAVDDAEMEVSDVVRGEDHLSNTPKQLLVFAALGIEPPRYAHIPLLHGPDGKKLSKRHGAASVQELRRSGYLPEAVRNYLALLGWGADDDETLLSTDELLRRFSIDRVGRSSAIFDEKKLRWINGRYMRESELAAYEARLAAHLEEGDRAAAATFAAADPAHRRAALAIVQDKAQVLSEVWKLIAFLFGEPVRDDAAWKKVMVADGEVAVAHTLSALSALGESDFTAARIEPVLRALAEREQIKLKNLLQPIRVAVSGGLVSPGLFESLEVLGREISLSRLDAARSSAP